MAMERGKWWTIGKTSLECFVVGYTVPNLILDSISTGIEILPWITLVSSLAVGIAIGTGGAFVAHQSIKKREEKQREEEERMERVVESLRATHLAAASHDLSAALPNFMSSQNRTIRRRRGAHSTISAAAHDSALGGDSKLTVHHSPHHHHQHSPGGRSHNLNINLSPNAGELHIMPDGKIIISRTPSLGPDSSPVSQTTHRTTPPPGLMMRPPAPAPEIVDDSGVTETRSHAVRM